MPISLRFSTDFCSPVIADCVWTHTESGLWKTCKLCSNMQQTLFRPKQKRNSAPPERHLDLFPKNLNLCDRHCNSAQASARLPMHALSQATDNTLFGTRCIGQSLTLTAGSVRQQAWLPLGMPRKQVACRIAYTPFCLRMQHVLVSVHTTRLIAGSARPTTHLLKLHAAVT